MPYLSFTRNREDVLIVRALAGIEHGYYVDVGAYRPILDSNTYALYLRGWCGLAVEPQRHLHDEWRLSRPRDVILDCAVGASATTIEFHEFGDCEQNATAAHDIIALFALEGRRGVGRQVAQVPLTDLLEVHRPTGDLHLLSVDVEGAEAAVLEGLDLSRFRPWLMVIESTVPNRFEYAHHRWEPRLLSHGYRYAYCDAVNRYYVSEEHGDLLRHFTYPACVWDDFIDYQLQQATEAAAAAKDELSQLKARLRQLAG